MLVIFFFFNPNNKKCFPWHFQEHHHTLENNQFSLKLFAAKNILCWNNWTESLDKIKELLNWHL